QSPNITPDPESGLGKWTDGKILRAVREGISRDGRPLFPMMPYATFGKHLGDDDALAIIAYLRTLKPIKNVPRRVETVFPSWMVSRAAPQPVEKPAGPPPTETMA